MVVRTMAFLAVCMGILSLVAGCGGGGGGGGGAATTTGGTDNTTQMGIMENSLNFTGTYPTPGDVAYTDTNGTLVSVTAYPGQVQVFFATTVSQTDAEAAIASAGGTVIERIPKIGYYLAQVSAGSEGAFIAAILQKPNVLTALPNTVAALEDVVIDEAYITGEKLVPLNVTGPIAIDSGQHGLDVVNASGGVIGQIVSLSSILDDQKRFSQNQIVKVLTAIAQGNDIYNPGTKTYVNMSNGGGAYVNGAWVDVTTLNAAGQAQAQRNWEVAVTTKLQAVANLPEEIRSRLAVSQSAGNCNMPIATMLANIENNPTLRKVLQENFTIYGTNLTTTPNSRYPTGNFSNYADNMNVVVVNNPEAANGTSFGAPFGLAMEKQVIAQTGASVYQTKLAMKLAADADGDGALDLNEATAAATTIKSTSDSVVTQAGVTESQSLQAIVLAINTNANGELVLAEAVDKANKIKEASAADSPQAASVTGIALTATGSTTSALIAPAISGVTVMYTVSGTDGYYDSGTLQTGATGQVSFFIPAGASGVVDTISVTAVLSGLSHTRTHQW